MNLDEVYEVWKPIISEQQIHDLASSTSSTAAIPRFPGSYNLIVQQEEQRNEERHTEMLEDFLIHAGAINLDSGNVERESKPLLNPVVQQQVEWLPYQLADAEQQQMALLSSMVFGNAAMNGGFNDNQQIGMPVVSMGMVRPTSSDSQIVTETNRSDGSIDKSIERKQKRMIKNRESAARSRARKQAYINKLQDDVGQLANRNKLLKTEKENLLRFNANLEPRYQLRRTSSLPLF